MTDKQYEERQNLEQARANRRIMSYLDLARLTAYRIHRDGSGRNGWDAMMNDLPDFIAEEIIDTWANIIIATMTPLLPEG